MPTVATTKDAASSFRCYQLAVGTEAQAFQDKSTQHTKKTEDLIFFDNLEFTASVSYTSDKNRSSTDDTTFEIYNLNPEMKSYFKTIGATVLLRAGYEDNFPRDENGYVKPNYEELPVIYLGTVEYAYTYKRGVDMITRVICSNDKFERAVTKSSVTYPAGTKREAIIRDLIKQLGFSVLEADMKSVSAYTYVNGFTVYGSTAEALTRVCEENGLRWFTFNKQIRIIQTETSAKTNAWIIYPENVIDSIQGYYKRTKKKVPKKAPKKPKPLPSDVVEVKEGNAIYRIKSGVRCKIHLDGRIRLGDNIAIKGTEDFDGQYRVRALNHSLNFMSGEWTTSLDLDKVSQ